MTTPLHFNDKILVHTPEGDLPGLFVALSDTPGVCRVTIYRDRCPAWFVEAHKSRVPQMFVALKDVEAG